MDQQESMEPSPLGQSEISGQRLCPLCGSMRRGFLFRRNDSELVECAECTMVFVGNECTYETQVADYDWPASYLRERARREREYPVLLFLSGLVRRLKSEMADRLLGQTLRWKQGGKLVDLGCADGAFLAKCARHFEAIGVEISPQLVERARQRLPAAILLGPVTQVPLPENAFDVVTQFGYLEHEWHPLGALRVAQRALKPGGITVIKVPNYASWNRRVLGQAWSGYRLPDHCNYFTPQTLGRMLIQAGLRPLRRSLLDRLPTSDTLWMAAEKPLEGVSRH